MLSGSNDPCVSWLALKDFQARNPAQLCPRVELLPENELPAELALSAVKIGADHALWGRLFDLHTDGWEKEARLDLLYRVLNAAGNADVVARVKAQREAERRAATPAPKRGKR